MNDLSWLIYLADVLPTLKSYFTGFLASAAFIGGVAMAGWTFCWLDKRAPRPWYGTYFLSLVVFSLGVVLTPSKETIYLIAASEAGETVVTSEAGQQVVSDIQQIIQHKLQELKGEEN